MQHTTLHRLVGIALLGAIAYILMLLEFPILPVAPWMKIDFSDIPILIGLFLFGVGGRVCHHYHQTAPTFGHDGLCHL
ncbi:ECF transporter S component [Lactiplantibacillus plantarum]|uniref:ECF transporter S component n=1 Tax=Lactiplantibacillus plantarum TaxID=1590 RepID=UPI0007BB5F9D|nr:ECF transporter S component [Lactiplantibacillus plantarum]KZU60178.1 Substrate-specific component RibU of riboflavinECF transporter [Lactiplantibacillus plantarum]MCI3954236.1 hypothetical protein [Lactiplantibacillus plantarum]MCX8537517.1 hypothetical protein [Lactiplantibacillus plantarum]WND26842.1 hypothetical protein RI128_07805 [Lactiplantibacillus plantarum]